MSHTWLANLVDPPALQQRNELIQQERAQAAPPGRAPVPPATSNTTWLLVGVFLGIVVSIIVALIIMFAVAMGKSKAQYLHSGYTQPTDTGVVMAAAARTQPGDLVATAAPSADAGDIVLSLS
jgi:hypothetical protein